MMRKYLALLAMFFMVTIAFSQEIEDRYFTDFGNAVGYIKTDDGKKYIVIETPSGAKLIEVNKDPEKVLKGNKGISREDFKIK